MKAILRHARITPKKANLVAGMVRGKSVQQALEILKFTPKKAAKILYKVVHSAAYNAKNNAHQPLEELEISRILVTPGPMLKRFLPVSRGRSHPILKRTAHITVEVGVPGTSMTPASPSSSAQSEKESTLKTASDKKTVPPKIKTTFSKKVTSSQKMTSSQSTASQAKKKKINSSARGR